MEFVNAKINIGLQIVRRRDDGYHELHTMFYPVGLYAGTALNPQPFCDMVDGRMNYGFLKSELRLSGRLIDCELERNLAWRAIELFMKEEATGGWKPTIWLDKHLPDGAGMGGGSADAAFTLRVLARLEKEYSGREVADERLAELALRLGADCPFFIYNRPMYAEGIGEKLEETDLDLSGCWIAVVKPKVYISTREAFSGVTPKEPAFDLRRLPEIPIEEWPELVHNDFEDSIFPRHAELAWLKMDLYALGAAYASMTGSGSALYGIFRSREAAESALEEISLRPTIEATYLLKA